MHGGPSTIQSRLTERENIGGTSRSASMITTCLSCIALARSAYRQLPQAQTPADPELFGALRTSKH